MQVDLNKILGSEIFGGPGTKNSAPTGVGDEFGNLLNELGRPGKVHDFLKGERGVSLKLVPQERPEGHSGIRPSLLWQKAANGKTSHESEVWALKEQPEGKASEVAEVLVSKEQHRGKPYNHVHSGTGQDSFKLKNYQDHSSESAQAISLQDILGVKSNEFSSDASLGNGLDILSLNDTKGLDTKGMVDKIVSYLIQNGIKNLDFLEVMVDHDELGRFKIDARKGDVGNQIDLKIEVLSPEARDFFQDNETALLKSLSRSGVNIQDLEIIDSKDNVLLSSFAMKDGGELSELNKLLQNEKDHSQYDRESHKKEERHYRPEEEFVNEEENDAEYR